MRLDCRAPQALFISLCPLPPQPCSSPLRHGLLVRLLSCSVQPPPSPLALGSLPLVGKCFSFRGSSERAYCEAIVAAAPVSDSVRVWGVGVGWGDTRRVCAPPAMWLSCPSLWPVHAHRYSTPFVLHVAKSMCGGSLILLPVSRALLKSAWLGVCSVQRCVCVCVAAWKHVISATCSNPLSHSGVILFTFSFGHHTLNSSCEGVGEPSCHLLCSLLQTLPSLSPGPLG